MHLPKNSVASKQVKNGSLQGADLKDGTLTGADVGDGTVTGGDIADGSVGAKDLARTAVPHTRLIHVIAVLDGPATTVFDDPAAGTISFSCGPGVADLNVSAQIPVSAQPGSVRISGADLADNNPVGASTYSSTVVQAAPYGVQFGGPSGTIAEGTVFIDSATKRLSLDWTVSGCHIRGVLVATDKATQPDSTSLARGSHAAPSCVEVGAAHCLSLIHI